MSKNQNFKKSLYNGGKGSLESLLALESDLEVLKSSAVTLKTTLRGLASIEKIANSRQMYFGGGEGHYISDWDLVLEENIQRSIIVIPHHGQFSNRLMSAISLSATSSSFPGLINENKDRINNISSELRCLKARLKAKYSKEVLSKIRSLVIELHSLLFVHLRRKQLKIKSVRITISYFFTRDLRNSIRRLISLISKFLCDCSGSEEEDHLFTVKRTSKQFSSFFQLHKKCFTQIILLDHSINILSR